jgi:four helix bundle protein
LAKFAYEDLDVWDKAVDFSVKVIDLVDAINTSRKHFRLMEQIEESSASISANLAEGKGRFSKMEFVQFCYIARGSLYETMTFLEIFKKKGWISASDLASLRQEAVSIASMVKGLINSIQKSTQSF